jgi:hypothetical protein
MSEEISQLITVQTVSRLLLNTLAE